MLASTSAIFTMLVGFGGWSGSRSAPYQERGTYPADGLIGSGQAGGRGIRCISRLGHSSGALAHSR
jgi:hypothetical protein